MSDIKDIIEKSAAKVSQAQTKSPVLDGPTSKRIDDLRVANQKLPTRLIIQDDRSVLYDYLRGLLKYGMDSQQVENCMKDFAAYAKSYTIYRTPPGE